MATEPIKDEFLEILRPLGNIDISIYVPPFANTLPLVYSYCNVLDSGIRPQVTFVSWRNSLPAQALKDDRSVTLCFTTARQREEAFKDVDVSSEELFAQHSIPITRYKPRYLFLQSTPIILDCAEKYDFQITESLLAELSKYYPTWDFYSDTEPQAESILNSLRNEMPSASFRQMYGRHPDRTTVSPDLKSPVLSLYYYSAPLASFLKSQSHRFVRLDLPERYMGDEMKFETEVLLLCRGLNDETTESVVRSVRDYYKLIFNIAATPKRIWQLVDFMHCYNRYAKQILLRDVFSTIDEFADCLSEHHEAPEPGEGA